MMFTRGSLSNELLLLKALSLYQRTWNASDLVIFTAENITGH